MLTGTGKKHTLDSAESDGGYPKVVLGIQSGKWNGWGGARRAEK